MGDYLRVGKLSHYVTSHPGQLSLAIPPWVYIGAMSTGDGYGHRKKKASSASPAWDPAGLLVWLKALAVKLSRPSGRSGSYTCLIGFNPRRLQGPKRPRGMSSHATDLSVYAKSSSSSASKTHWATRFLQLLLSSHSLFKTSSQLMTIFLRSFLTTSFQFCRGRHGILLKPSGSRMRACRGSIHGDPFVKDAQAISDVCI